jgi:propionyl-CoA carboxylase alpha chain
MAIAHLLVANRGEIARRVIRAAHHLGIEAVAVYADDDRDAPHVREADRAVALGAGRAAAYLSVEAIVDAAVRAGADAVHPGYGFLSEDPRLADACAAAGLLWVGPPSAAMTVMGHKARAKVTVAAAGVPVLPSAAVDGGADAGALRAAATTVGFPVLVKASAGGGGRGMRVVDDEESLAGSVDAAQREAAAAFGSGEVFLERFVRAARHIEVQVLADQHGTIVHLSDRECSIQRRHQKLVEEAPAIFVPEAVRHRMWGAAVDAARAVDYVGAGTVEFLVDGDDCFFLEMNTRLQVEHGVTELVTGRDLVVLQLEIADGRPLGFDQDGITPVGHAIEVRLCAERPSDNFRPTPGRVVHARWPDGDGIRVDAGVETGSVVSAAYDSLVAKVLSHGPRRDVATARLRRALADLELDGLETNRDLLAAILADPLFGAGDISTEYLAQNPSLVAGPGDEVRCRHAAAAAVALERARAVDGVVVGAPPSWRNVGRALHADALHDGSALYEARVERTRAETRVVVTPHDGADRVIRVLEATAPDGTVRLEVGDGVAADYRVRPHDGAAGVNGPEGQSTFTFPTEGADAEGAVSVGECRAPLPGAVSAVLVAVGDEVADGAALVVLEAMKMEHTLRAAGPGRVTAVKVSPGNQVDVGELLVVTEPLG